MHTSIEPLKVKDNISIQCRTNDNSKEINPDENSLAYLKNSRQQAIKTLGFHFDDNFLANKQIADSTLNQIIGFSWVCLKSGGYDIACQLLEQVKNHVSVNVVMQEKLFMHLLMIRFFSHQYTLITESDFPEDFAYLEQSEVQTIRYLKTYSATLSRNLNIARDFFKKCDITTQIPISDENSLYQLNLFALFQVLQGETDTAFELEFRIKAFIEEHKIDTVGLKYVNFINIARLYKKTKDYEQSLSYYNKAYNEISGGGYTTSDHIYYNMNLGSLYEAAGKNEQALLYWVKTALHWLACSNKYELSWRPRLILCQEKLSDISNPLPIDRAHQFLLEKIEGLVQLCGIEINCKFTEHYQFIDDNFDVKKNHCFIKNNILLYTGQSKSISLSKSSSAEYDLSTLVTQYIHMVMEIPADQNVFIIDTQLDARWVANAEEAVAFAGLANCSSCFFNGQWLEVNNLQSLKSVSASLSKIISSISQTEKGLLVHYKRSFLNKMILDQDEIALVTKLQQDNSLNLEDISSGARTIAQQLAKKRILNFSYST